MNQFTGTKINQSINMLSKKAHDCKQSEQREIILPESHQQYSRIECAVCGRWITWGRDPKLTEEHEARILIIDRYLKYPFLTLWQKEFLRNIRDKRFLTEKQKGIYKNIVALFRTD